MSTYCSYINRTDLWPLCNGVIAFDKGLLTSVHEPLPYSLSDVKGNPLQRSFSQNVLASDVTLLSDVLIGTKNLPTDTQNVSLKLTLYAISISKQI